MALGLTQPLTDMNMRNISCGVKAAGGYGWQPYHLHAPIVLKSGSLSLLETSGPIQACNGIAVPFTTYHPHWPSGAGVNDETPVLILWWYSLAPKRDGKDTGIPQGGPTEQSNGQSVLSLGSPSQVSPRIFVQDSVFHL